MHIPRRAWPASLLLSLGGLTVACGASDPSLTPGPTDDRPDARPTAPSEPPANSAPPQGSPVPPDASTDAGAPDALAPRKTHAQAVCAGNDVYWTSSCGQREELKEHCIDGYTCAGGQCKMSVIGTATLVTEDTSGADYCRLYVDGSPLYWAVSGWLRQMNAGVTAKIWDPPWPGGWIGKYGFFVSGDTLAYGHSPIKLRSISRATETSLDECGSTGRGTGYAVDGGKLYYRCGQTIYSRNIGSVASASSVALGASSLPPWLDEVVVGGGYVHFRVEDRAAGAIRYCAVPEHGGTVQCNPTVAGGSGAGADCFHTDSDWTASGGSFYCLGREPTTGSGLKSFGLSGPTHLVGVGISTDGYSRLRVMGDHLYFKAKTATANVYAPARMRFDGTDRRFLAAEPIYGFGDITTVSGVTYFCGPHEGANLTLRLYRLQ